MHIIKYKNLIISTLFILAWDASSEIIKPGPKQERVNRGKASKVRPSLVKPETDGYVSIDVIEKQARDLKTRPSKKSDGYVPIEGDGYISITEAVKAVGSKKKSKKSASNMVGEALNGYTNMPLIQQKKKIKETLSAPDGYTLHMDNVTNDGYTTMHLIKKEKKVTN